MEWRQYQPLSECLRSFVAGHLGFKGTNVLHVCEYLWIDAYYIYIMPWLLVCMCFKIVHAIIILYIYLFYVHRYVAYVHIDIHICIRIHIHTNTCMHAYRHTYTHTDLHVTACANEGILMLYVCIYLFTYSCRYCMCVCAADHAFLVFKPCPLPHLWVNLKQFDHVTEWEKQKSKQQRCKFAPWTRGLGV